MLERVPSSFPKPGLSNLLINPTLIILKAQGVVWLVLITSCLLLKPAVMSHLTWLAREQSAVVRQIATPGNELSILSLGGRTGVK